MASGGIDVGDSRKSCSICMEEYRGRNPKLLPCFHTFCLPCLTALEERAKQQQASAGGDSVEASAVSDVSAVSLTIICPTCRKDVSVPPEGVASFQTNFYLDHDGAEELQSSKPRPCDLCDGTEEAYHHCSKCQYGVCSKCVRYHDKFCQLKVVSTKWKADDTNATLKDKAEDQLKILNAALANLTEKEKCLEQERKSIEHNINTLYCAALGYIADARDEAFRSLRDTSKDEQDALQAEVTSVNNKKTRLSKMILQSSSMDHLHSALIPDNEIKHYEFKLAGIEASIFYHQRDSSAVSQMQEFCLSYMGKVLPAKLQTSDTNATHNSAVNTLVHAATSTVKSNGDSLHKSVNQAGCLPTQNSSDISVQLSVDQWRTDFNKRFAQLEVKTKSLEDENSSLRYDLRCSLEKNAKFLSDFAVMQREFGAVRDKHAILCQDMAAAQAEKSKMCEQLQAARTDITGLQTSVANIQQSVSTENGKLQGENTRMSADLVQLKKIVTDIQQVNLPVHVVQLQKSVADVVQDIPRLRLELSTQLTTVKGDQTKLKADLGSSKGRINNLQQQLSSLQKRLPAVSTAGVAFHAVLDKNVTTTTERALILKHIGSNIGGGYDAQTGIFTAPVTGIYLFMATAGPNSRVDGAQSILDIVLENNRIAYLCAYQVKWATCHTVTKVNFGEQVWLRTHNERCVFGGGWWTSFSGVLVQPE